MHPWELYVVFVRRTRSAIPRFAKLLGPAFFLGWLCGIISEPGHWSRGQPSNKIMISHQKFGFELVSSNGQIDLLQYQQLECASLRRISSSCHHCCLASSLLQVFLSIFLSWEHTHSVAKYEMLLSITISHNLICSSLLAVNFSVWAQFRWWYHVWRISMKNVVLVGWYAQILLVINIRLRSHLKSWAKFLTN